MNEIGICTNLGDCKIADKKIKISLSSNEEKLCPGCKQKLYILDGVQIKSKYLFIFAIAILIAIALMSIYLKSKNENQAQTVTPVSEAIASTVSDDFDLIVQKKKVQIGVQANSPPFNFIDAGNRVGLDLEIARLIFSQSEFSNLKREAITNEQEVPAYSQIPSLLKIKKPSGEFSVDIVMGGLTFDDDEKNEVQYSIPYIDGFGYSLIARKNGTIKSEKDLGSRKIGVTKGDVDVISFVKATFPNSTVIELEDGEPTWIVDAIKNQRVDAVVYDYPFAGPAIKDTNLEIVVAKIKDLNLTYKIGVRSKSKKLISKLNSAIQKVRLLPAYEQLIEKYLYADVNIAAPVMSSAQKLHTVVRGETLSIIVRDHLGSLDRVNEVAKINNLPNPNFISVNSKLIMPNDYK